MRATNIIFILLTISLYASSCRAKKHFFFSFYKLFDFLQKDGQANNGTHTNKTLEEMTDELGVSRGRCLYEFISFVGYDDMEMCSPDDEYILHLLPSPSATEVPRKPPIMVKCLLEHTLIGNDTNELRIMNSVQEIVDLLKPIGNNTKRYQPGSCVVVFFYTPTCLGCSLLATPISKLPYAFKTLPVAAIDAYKFPSFNTEFGIVALPTVMLFHQGRPVVKYKGQGNCNAFVTRHTGLKPADVPKNLPTSPLVFSLENRTDYVLIMAWLFILSCAGYYFAQSRLCTQIVEMVKRNWRESEELEHNN
ncbi:uncharacterized protein LOC106091315 [Stomoxys calcitrans]|uniref:uncharacterized protein LOC106091315 n=1 Tax=Stomoxys calcitrans TaxID=35570 RepID=UPI0027E2258D|nr:uncharacterized protein LOC106091315 [Stomoxys calcitrans]